MNLNQYIVEVINNSIRSNNLPQKLDEKLLITINVEAHIFREFKTLQIINMIKSNELEEETEHI